MVYDKSYENKRIERLEKQVAALTVGLEILRDILAEETGVRPFEILNIDSFDY